MADSSWKPSTDDSVSRREEQEIRESLRDIFAIDFPNPERRGCPENAEAMLKALAWRRRFPKAQELISHLGSCSPCYREHEEYLRQRRSRQRLYELAAVGLLTVGVALWVSWRLLIGPGSIPDPPAIVRVPPAEPVFRTQTPDPQIRKQKPSEVQLAVLDLRKRGITRGPNNDSMGDLTLPRERLKLSIYLPFGSEVGQFEVQIHGRQKELATAKGMAVMRKHIAVLDVKVDTSTFRAGTYTLAIRQVGWGWHQYPLRLR